MSYPYDVYSVSIVREAAERIESAHGKHLEDMISEYVRDLIAALPPPAEGEAE